MSKNRAPGSHGRPRIRPARRGPCRADNRRRRGCAGPGHPRCAASQSVETSVLGSSPTIGPELELAMTWSPGWRLTGLSPKGRTVSRASPSVANGSGGDASRSASKSRCFCRFQSRLAEVSRLSAVFLPFAIPIFSFAMPLVVEIKPPTAPASFPCRCVAFQSREELLFRGPAALRRRFSSWGKVLALQVGRRHSCSPAHSSPVVDGGVAFRRYWPAPRAGISPRSPAA